MKTKLFLLISLLSLSNAFAQFSFNFDDQDLSQWQQHPENKWAIQSSGISGYSLKHNYTSTLTSAQDAISAPIIDLYPNQTDITWKFMLRHQYAPSDQNYWLVYLGVDANAYGMLVDNGILNGYAIGINANNGDDRLTLYKVTNGLVTTILRTTYNWQTKVGNTTTSTGTVEVKRSPAGQWSIRAGTPSLGSSLGSVMDTEHTNFTNTGIRYTYSAGASKKLIFDNYTITYTQASPPNDSDSEILSSSSSPPDFSIPTSTLTASQAQPFLKLNFLDKGTNDTKPTNIQSILLHKTAASVPLNLILGGITAFANETPIPISYTIYTDSVRLDFTTAYALPSGSQQEIDFHLWLKPATITDHSTLQFKVDKNQHGAKAKANGSQFVANLSEDIVSASIDIDVRASQISMDSCATLVSKDTDFGLRGTAKDEQNNIDVDYNLEAEVSLAEGLGLLSSSSGLNKNFVSGRVEWTDLRYNQQDPFKVQISGGDLRRDTSDLINVAFVLDEDSEVRASIHPVLGHEISSLKVEATDEVEVFRFVVNDRGTSDQRPTLLKEIRFDNPTACDWTQTLAQVFLYHNDVKLPTHLPVLTRQSIQLQLENNLLIPDGDSTEISVRIILRKKVNDGDTLQLRIPILHLFQTVPTGSGIQGVLNDVITSDKFILNVETSQIVISRQVLQTRVGEVFDLEIKATDIWGAVDSSNHETVDLTAIGGTLSSPEGLSKTMTKGVVKWVQLSINDNTVFQIKVQQSELEVLSQAIAAVDLNSTVLVPLSQIPSGNFSSSDTSALLARAVMKLVVKDQGAYDSLGTALACIRLQNSNVAVSDLSEIIGGVVLKQGNTVIAANSQIDAQSISIYPEDFVIPDGTQAELTVAMYLKPDHDREGTVLQFVVPKIAHGWSVKSNSSQLLDEFPQAIRSNPLTIESQNDQLIILHQDFLAATNGRFKIEVGVGDPSFVLNTAFEGSIEATLLEGNGTLTGQTQINIVNGKANFDLQYTGLGTFTLQLSTAGLSKINSYDITSSTDITLLKEDQFETNTSSANGSLAEWKFENKTLRHQSGSGRSIVAYTVQADLKKRHSEWRFSLENGNFDPSADNAFWWVLASEDPDLEQSGYMIGVNYTGNWDLISFWRRDTAGTKKLIWESNFNWDAKQKVDFVVSRTENGIWTVALKLPSKELRSFPSFVENTFDKITYTGLVFKYTPTRRGLLWLDNFQFVQANTPPRIQSVRFLASDSLLIAFDEGMQQSSALSNFELLSTKDNTLIDLQQIVWKSDSLAVLSTAIMQDSSYYLSVKGFSDIDLWPIHDTTVFVSRMASHYTFGVKVINRKTLMLTPSTPFHSSIEAEADKMHIINQSRKRLNVGQVEKQGTAVHLTCDGLEGQSYTLYLNEVSMSDGFKTTDSVRFDSVFLPAKAIKVEVLSPKSLKLTFDKTLKTTVLDNYQLRNAQQVQIPIESISHSDKSVNLSLSNLLQGSQFVLTYRGIVDQEDFVLHDSIRFTDQRLKFSDLVFSEVMYKPSPVVGLPAVEYLELYNRTLDTIDLAGLRIVTDKGVVSKINACKLPPHNYASISSSSSSSKLSEYGGACSATNFPSLLDVGMSLRLMDDTTDLAIVNYLPSWHSNTDKVKGGWSLERIDINNLSDDQNWKSSEDVRGGTPGQANSVASNNPDSKKPQVSSWRINEVGNMVLSFDEWMLSDSLQIKAHFGGIDIENVLNVGTFVSLSVEIQPTVALVPNQIYSLQISNLVDLSGNIIIDTTISVFRTGPQVQSYKVHSADSLQITFDRSMRIADLSTVANYQLKTSAGTSIVIQAIPDQFGRNVHFKTARFTDTLLYLSISGITDLNNLPLIDTTVTIRRTAPRAKGALRSASRSELVLELDQSIPQNTILDTTNFRLTSDGKVVKIYSVVSDNLSRAVLTRLKFVTDPLQGNKITLHWKQLEISSGFLISDSLDLSHSYLPAKVLKVEPLSPKSLKLTFDKALKTTILDNYQLRNAQQVQIPIVSISHSDKSVNLSLSNPLQGSQFVLTYQGIVDSEDFVLHDSIRFTDQRLKFSDLVFSEVMYKPSPAVGLPGVEYLELFNRTSDTIDLAGLRIVTDKGVVSKINACKLPPHNYVTISSSSSSSKLSEFGRACSATNFPSLLDVGMSLRLMDDTTDLAIVNYLPSWHSNTDKAKGGWSLERIDVNNLSDDQNWKSSEHVRGGTPGQANSVAGDNPDTKKPQVSSWRVNEVGNIVLSFDEWMLSDSLQIKNHFGGIDIANVLNVGSFASLSVELQPTTVLIPNQIYKLQISNLLDLSGNFIVDTIVSVFRTGLQVQSYKVHSADSLQITFDRSMRIADLSAVANYQLKTSEGQDVSILQIKPDQFGRNVHFKTARFTDTLLYLSISGMTDLDNLPLIDTTVTIRRTAPRAKGALKSTSRSELVLELDQLLSQNAILDTTNFRLTNDGKAVKIHSVVLDNLSRAVLTRLKLVTDPLQGKKITLHWKQLEINSGFLISDSLDLSHSYLPAKALKAEVLSPKSIKLTFDKVIKASVLEDYQLRNAQQVQIPIASISHSDKSVNIVLASPLQGSQFVLTYRGIVDSEDFVLHDSIRFTDQRLKFSDLVFSEVMYKPSPVVGLPAVEYLELYNRTSDTIDLAGLRIVTDKGVASKINACKLPPYNFVTISSSSGSSKLSEFGRVCSATNFPSLLDVGMPLRLMDDSTDLAIVNYLPTWQTNSDKAKGGWSLERIDVNNLSDDQNWKSSEDVRGGTPGQANSVAGENPDTKKPQVSSWRVNEIGNIVLSFDEWMLGDSLQIKNYFGGIDIVNVLNVGAFASLSVELQPTVALIPNQIYNLHIRNLVDLSGNIIVDTIVSVFQTGPQVQSYKVHSADSLQITFDRSMRITDLSIAANYQLKTSAGTDIAIQAITPDQFGRNVHFKTARFTDTLLYLSISGMTDLTDLSLSDTIVSIHRTLPKIKSTLKSLSRSELSLELDQLLSQNAILDTTNFRLTNDGKAVKIHSVVLDNLSRAVLTRLKLVTDPLQGKKITLHWKQLEINSGFLISDSLDLSHSYLPARAIKAEVLSPKSLKLTFDKTIKTTVMENYQLRNGQQVQIPIESVSHSDKSVSLSLANPLQGLQFTLTYQGIVDSEDFVLHDSIRFTDQRLKFSDLVFSEVMYKPSPVVGLPGVEYLELYNRTSDTIDLAGLRIVTDKGVASKINACKLPPHNFVTFSSSSSSSKLSEFGLACSATNFPSLLDVGMSLRLMNDSTDLAIVNYLPSWQTNTDKAKGGWSLERIDINNLSDDQNWKSSEDVRGGTPGQANSVAANNPDTKKPRVSSWRINEVGNIVLSFDEWMLSDSLHIKAHFGGIDIANVLNVGTFASLSVELQPTTALIPNQIYNLQIRNLVDLSGNFIVDTIVSVFRTGPQVQSYKVHSADSLQITFDRSMRMADLSIVANYQLKTSAGTSIVIQAIAPDQFGRNVYLKTARFTDTLLYLSISQMTDLTGLSLSDTIVSIHRTPPKIKATLKSLSRSELSLEFDQLLSQNFVPDTANFRLTTDTQAVKIHSVISDNLSRAVLTRLKLVTDPLQGKKITLHWKQLEISSGFLISDSLDLSHSYLPAKALKAEVLSPKSIKLTFDKVIKASVLDNYQLRNAQQAQIPIESVSHSDKSVNLSLSSPLQGSQFVLTYQGIVDSEDFVLHDSVRFTDQRLKFSDLVFSEVMYKPSPVVALPGVEYLELYNRTSDTIDLAGLRIVTDKGVASKINACKLPPHNFVTVSSSSSSSKLSEFGLACSATNFPSLLDVGMPLRLMDDSTDLAIVNYLPSWHSNSYKAKGGWSLERIDVNNLSDDQNWKSSEDVRGGTPGQANSIAGDNPDTKKPQVSLWRVNEVGNIVLVFDEWMLSDSLQVKNNFGGIDIANVLNVGAFASSSVELQPTTALIPNQIYNLNIRNLVDLSGNVIVDTLMSVFRTGPQVQSYKVHSADSLQITFDRSMRMADLSIAANYQLKTSADKDVAIQAITPDQFGRNVHFKTARFTDTLLYLSISVMTDLTGLSLNDTIVAIHRTPPKIKATLKSLSRSELSLELDQSILQNVILDTANFRLIVDTQAVKIYSVVSDNLSRAVLTRLKFVTDPLQGKKITLHWKQLEINSGFLISDSLDLSHSYLPAKALKVEPLSPKSLKLTFDKTIKTTVIENYQLRNAQQVQIPITSISHSDKSVNLSLSNPLQGSQFVLTYQGIVDSEDFVLHDSIRFTHQRLKFSDLVFSEVMYKPSPVVGLPGVEYLELYNRTSDTIDLAGLRIITDKGVVSKINACKLPPHNYVTVSSSSSSSKLSEYGGACSATNFPSLLDVGMPLRLMDDTTDLAIVNYLPSWHSNSDKAKGGWSLERIDINNLSDDQNWKSSEDVRGGTPGQANSVAANNPDTKKPQVSSWRINEVGNIVLVFDEWMLNDSLQIKTHFEGIDIVNVLNVGAFASLSVELQPTNALIPNQIYNLQIRNLVDLSGNFIVDTIVLVFRTGPQVQSYKVHSADSLQITFDRSMKINNLSNVTNYQLKTSTGTDIAIQNIVPDQFGRNVHFKTARFTDTLLYLSISGMTDLTGLILVDTIVSIHRTLPKIKSTLKSLLRSELVLELDQSILQNAIIDTANFRLTSDGKAVKIHSVVLDNLSRAVLTRLKLITDPLQGKKITLHWNQLEMSSGFLISDSLDLSHSYLPAKVLKVEPLSPKSLKLTFDKTLKTTVQDNYQLRNAQQVQIPIESISHSDKTVNLSLSSPLQGSQFVLTYQGIVDSEGFVLHDSIRFIHQRLKFSDLVFSEVMYKPSPVVGLPAVEYLELYNRTSDTIDLAGLRIVTGKGVSSKINACKLPPHNYASISSSSSSSKLSEYGLACSATNFPSLLDVGMPLRLMDDSTDLAIVNYLPSWHSNTDKAKGGWSLERIDINNLSDDQNWKSSEDVRGGTPGQANSIAGDNPDTQKPFLLNWLITEDGSLLLTFNEALELESAQNMSNYNLNGTQALSLHLTENAVLAHFDHSFIVGETAVLTISDVKDLSGNECEWIEINIGLFEDIKEHEILINEVLFYPNTGGNDFVEIYNNSQKPIDLMQLKLASRNKKDGSVQQISSISQPYILLPQAYAVLGKDVGNLSQFYQTDDATLVYMKSFPSYSNDEGSVVLLNSSDLMIDEFNYHKNMHFKLLRTQQGVSLERINFDLPTNAESRWHSAAASVGFATPGYKNSQFSESKLSETGAFTIQPSIFSPDSDGFDDILYIDYQLSDPGYLANIIIFDIQGRKVKELAKQLSLNTEGRLSWDGLTDQNILAGVGLYVIYFELFDLQGNVKSYKKTVVLTVR